MSRKYLAIVDSHFMNEEFKEYFATFNYDLLYYQHLSQLDQSNLPATLLINSSLLPAGASEIRDLYWRYLTPLIIISDEVNEDLCVQMLEAGADDFLIKPLHPRELHARMGAISRRILRSKLDLEKEVLLFSNWRVYPASRTVLDNATRKELLLSAGEYDLLLIFLRQPQRVLGRNCLLQFIKNNQFITLDRRIDVQISRLRQKIEVDARKPVLIKTIRNSGYLFTPEVMVTTERSSGFTP